MSAELSIRVCRSIFHLGNDYTKGILVSTGYVGQRTPQLVTCFTEATPACPAAVC